MSDLIDITNSKYLYKARENKSISEILKKIELMIASTSIKKISLSMRDFKEIINNFPSDSKMHLMNGFEYKNIEITPCNW